jgi:hypothetical protein
MPKRFDYSEFDPRRYVAEYYSSLGPENRFLLDFYGDCYSRIPPGGHLLEFGGGPTIYQLLSAGERVDRITFAEFLPANRGEVAKWLRGDSEAINWDTFIQYHARGNRKGGQNGSGYEGISENVRSQLREKITEIIECDAYLPSVLMNRRGARFDVVSTSFCLECISGELSDFEGFMSKVCALLKPHGHFIMTALKNASSYRIAEREFPAVAIDEAHLAALLPKLGLRISSITSVAAEHDQGYSGLIALSAQRA